MDKDALVARIRDVIASLDDIVQTIVGNIQSPEHDDTPTSIETTPRRLKQRHAEHQKGVFVIETPTDVYGGISLSNVHVASNITVPRWKVYRLLKNAQVAPNGHASVVLADDGIRLIRLPQHYDWKCLFNKRTDIQIHDA